MSCTKPVIMQSVKIYFNEVLLQYFARDNDSLSTSKIWAPMSSEEAAIRYSGGFVAMKRMKYFFKKNRVKAQHFVKCRTHMTVDGGESSFLEYTQM